MKFTSVIFIFVSIILIFGGAFAMNYARDLAGDDILIDGYSWSKDGSNSVKTAIDESELSQISVTLSNCDVVIAGGEKESYIELINFKPNTYICSASTKSLTVSDDISITDYLSFDGSGVKFAGVWQTLYSEYNARKYGNEEGKRSVVIHLQSYSELKQINLTLNSCKLRLHDVVGKGDIKISAEKSDIELTNIGATVMVLDGTKTDYSVLNLKAEKITSALETGSINATSLEGNKITMELGEVTGAISKAVFRSFDLDLEKGNFTLDTDYDMTCFGRDLETKTGTLTINGADSGSSFKSDKNTEYPASIKAEIKEGDLDLKFGSTILLPAEPTEPSDPGATPSDPNGGTEPSTETGTN